MIEICQMRRTSKIFVKESKQLSGANRCQSNSFDAQIADTTITTGQYRLLSMRYRIEPDESMMGLFPSEKEAAVKQWRLDQRLRGLFIKLIQIVTVLFEDIDEQELLKKTSTPLEKIAHRFKKISSAIIVIPDETDREEKFPAHQTVKKITDVLRFKRQLFYLQLAQ